MFKRSIKFRLLFVMGVASIITISAIVLAYLQLVNHAKDEAGEKIHKEVKKTGYLDAKKSRKNFEEIAKKRIKVLFDSWVEIK